MIGSMKQEKQGQCIRLNLKVMLNILIIRAKLLLFIFAKDITQGSFYKVSICSTMQRFFLIIDYG
jgi:hypothetical protein